MPSTLVRTCSLSGLRFASRPLLELHIREDHVPRDRRAEPGHGDPGDARTSQPGAGGLSGRGGLASGRPRGKNEVIAVTAARRPRGPRAAGPPAPGCARRRAGSPNSVSRSARNFHQRGGMHGVVRSQPARARCRMAARRSAAASCGRRCRARQPFSLLYTAPLVPRARRTGGGRRLSPRPRYPRSHTLLPFS